MHNKVVTTHRTKQRRSIALRLVLASLVITTLVALVFSLVGSHITREQEQQSALQRFTQIKDSYLPVLEQRLWEVNPAGVDAVLEGIARLPDVGIVTLVDEQHQTLQKNADDTQSFATRQFELVHEVGNRKFHLGTLSVDLSATDSATRTAERNRHIIITLVAALLVNSVILLVLLHRMIIHHLERIADFVARFSTDTLSTDLTLQRLSGKKTQDEIDLVVDAINQARQSLRMELGEKAKSEARLIDYQNNLEIEIARRTQALQSSNELLEVASNLVGLGIWRLDITSQELTWNDNMYHIYRLDKNQFSGKDLAKKSQSYIHQEDTEKAIDNVRQAVFSGQVHEQTFRINAGDSSLRYLRSKAKAIKNEQGDVVEVIGVVQDITAQAELESHLRQAKDQADAANAAKTNFLANMSHEIRTPMNAVLGMLSLLGRTSLKNQQQDYVSKANSAATSLLYLLNDLLDYSKIEAGKLELETAPFELELLLQDLAIVMAGNQNHDQVDLIFDIDTHIPAVLIGDRLRLQQCLINLASNALKFTSQGYIKLEVHSVDQTAEAVLLKFSITDTGIGIDSEQQENIFNVFSQAEASTSRRYGGTGLGLAITRQLVDLMDGMLQVDSEPGKGSRFWFEVPLAYTGNDTLHDHHARDLKGYQRALVIEDNQPSLMALSRFFASYDIELQNCVNGAEAAEKITTGLQSQRPINLIIIDGNLPNLISQLQSLTAIHFAQPKYAPQILVLANNASQCQSELEATLNLQNQQLHIINRPFTPRQMISALHTTVSLPSLPEVISASEPLSQRLQDLYLLVVEDNPLNQEIARELLEAEGAHVTIADSGVVAVEQVLNGNQAFDLIIMDIQMPEMDGYEATRTIRSDQRFTTLPILAMTANVSDHDRQLCADAGMNEHIGKPFDINELVSTILQLTERRAGAIHPSAPSATATPTTEEVTSANHSPIIEPLTDVLRRFANKLELYEKVLRQFEPHATEMLNKIEHYISASDTQNVRETLHGLKGTAKTVGAASLGHQVAELEAELKALPADSPLPGKFNTELMLGLRAVLSQTIQALWHQLPAADTPNDLASEKPVTAEAPAVIDTARWLPIARQLLELLESHNMQALNVMEKLQSLTPDTFSAPLATLSEYIEHLDFNNAIDTLTAFIQQVENA